MPPLKRTRMSYMYRDAFNYKYTESITVEGSLTFRDLKPYLNDGEYFAPDDVGLPHPGREHATGWPSSDDHCWCELAVGDFKPANDSDETLMLAKDLIAAFKKASEEDWPAQTETFGEE